MLSPVIFLPTNNVDEPKFTSDTFLLSIFAYNPLSSPILILGTPKANVVLIFDEFKAPLHIPVIVGTADRVTLNPSPDTVSILLNLSTVSPSGVYLNMVPVLIPAKLKLPFNTPRFWDDLDRKLKPFSSIRSSNGRWENKVTQQSARRDDWERVIESF